MNNNINRLTISKLVIAVFVLLFLLVPLNEINLVFPTFIAANKVYVDTKYIIVGLIFVFTTVIDFLNNYVTKKDGLVNIFDTSLDEIAKRIMLDGLLIILAYNGFISIAIPIVILVRELLLENIKDNMRKKNIEFKINGYEKAKNIFLNIGIILLLFYNLPFELWNIHLDVIMVCIGTSLSIISLLIYYFRLKNASV